MKIITFLECFFLGLIVVRLAWLRRSVGKKYHFTVGILIWLGIVAGLMSIFHRLNKQDYSAHLIDLLIFVLCCLFLYVPLVIKTKWRK